jgi:Arc/MetJ-type ribon-helix-helix transcriptional regulator
MATRKITITLPEEVLTRTREAVSEGTAENVSAYVTQAIKRFQEEQELAELIALMVAKGGEPSEEDSQWARHALGIEE